MITINATLLRTLGISFSAAYNRGLTKAKPQWDRVATKVPSTTSSQEYGWMQELPQIKEWVGERAINNLSAYSYTIKNKLWEETIGVKRTDIEDDNLGLFTPRFEMLGQRVSMFPDNQVFSLLKAGAATACYDGQNFFDAAHPIIDATGAKTTTSNYGGGAGNLWVLMDASQPLLPVVYQERRPFDLTAMTAPTDEAVFSKNEYRWGIDGRANVGFGLWHTAYGSKQALTDPANYAAAYTALVARTQDNGVKLGLTPNLLVVGPSNIAAAFALVKAQTYVPSGGTYPVPNPWYGSAEVLVTPYFD